jgi:hypothetical protein
MVGYSISVLCSVEICNLSRQEYEQMNHSRQVTEAFSTYIILETSKGPFYSIR